MRGRLLVAGCSHSWYSYRTGPGVGQQCRTQHPDYRDIVIGFSMDMDIQKYSISLDAENYYVDTIKTSIEGKSKRFS